VEPAEHRTEFALPKTTLGSFDSTNQIEELCCQQVTPLSVDRYTSPLE